MTTATADQLVGSEVSRRDRSFGVAVALLGLLAALVFTADGQSVFALNLRGAAITIPDITFTTTPVVLALAVVMVALGVYQAARGSEGREVVFLAIGVGLLVIGFLAWAANGTSINLTQLLRSTARSATPIALGALCGVIGEKSGVINIAIEGQLLAGAFAGAVISSFAGPWVGILAAIAGSLFIGMILAVLSVKYRSDQIVVGVVLIVFASGLTAFLVQQLPNAVNRSQRFQPFDVPGLSDIPILGPLLFNQTPVVYMMFGSVALVTFLLYQTRWGLRVRAVGEKPKAADTVGVSVERMRYQAVAFGAVFAGLGGAYYTLDSSGQFIRDMTAGAGFIALAAMLVGRHHPVGGFLAAILFGFSEALATSVAIAGVPIDSNVLATTPYVVTILVVAGVVGRIRVPAAGGQPYVKE